MDMPGPHGEEEHYPDERQYIKIALILFAITMFEVGIYYVSGVTKEVITLMIFSMIAKFTLVALFFMHLRFDSRLFRRLFVTGIILAIAVYSILLTTLHIFQR